MVGERPMAKGTRHERHFFLGLCASLLAHGCLVSFGLEAYIKQLESRIAQPGWTRDELVIVRSPAPAEFILGDATGSGTAIDRAEAPDAMRSPLQADQDQPFASLDPSGQNGEGPPAAAPAPAVEPMPEQLAARFGVPEVAAPVVPKAPGPSRGKPKPATSPVTVQEVAHADMPKAEPVEPVEDVTRQVAVASPQKPSPAPGDAAPQTETEIDPFARTASVDFRSGKTDVQFGRRSKLRRPDILLAGQMDLIASALPRVTLGIRTDAKGKVVDAQVLRSSGSKNIDQPVRLVAYDWWFEPPLGEDGQPIPDSFAFTITFR